MDPSELRMLESLADMVASQLELRRLRNAHATQRGRRPRASSAVANCPQDWPLPQDLRNGLDRRQFVLYYQPEIELTTRKIVGLEALIRWEPPNGA